MTGAPGGFSVTHVVGVVTDTECAVVSRDRLVSARLPEVRSAFVNKSHVIGFGESRLVIQQLQHPSRFLHTEQAMLYIGIYTLQNKRCYIKAYIHYRASGAIYRHIYITEQAMPYVDIYSTEQAVLYIDIYTSCTYKCIYSETCLNRRSMGPTLNVKFVPCLVNCNQTNIVLNCNACQHDTLDVCFISIVDQWY